MNGYNLFLFCAGGGAGGYSDFFTNCYAYCGCNFYSQGCASGCCGDVVANGGVGMQGMFAGVGSLFVISMGGQAGGPGGGAGGVNSCLGCACNGEHGMHGRVPGGGGAGSGCWAWCNCCVLYSGRGGPGMVRIQF